MSHDLQRQFFSRKGPKTPSKTGATRQRFASLFLCARNLPRLKHFFLLLLLALTSAITLAQKTDAPPAIKNFGRVNENYFRGSQPTESQMAALKAMGIKTIIDLRRDYIPEERQWANQLGLSYFNLSLKPSKPATKEETEYFLRLVNDPANAPVYVHCKGGRHRTGALTAIYRITHDGWTAQQAFEEMKKYDFNDGLFGGPSEQKKFVFDFYEQQKKSGRSVVGN